MTSASSSSSSPLSSSSSAAEPRVEIRPCQSIDEFRACVALQKEVWNFQDADLVPLRMFVVAEEIGGQIIGGFHGQTLVGFSLSVPGTHDGVGYLHSHMLAVTAPYRNSGLGRRIKLAQRQDALRRGVDLIEWTFDPLEIKNAYLNLMRLGAVVRQYSVDHYGASSSPLHRGLPTDRLIAQWWLKSKRVTQLLESGSLPPFQTAKTISVPAQIYAWRSSEADLPKAAQVQKQNREEFLEAFSKGLAAMGFARDQSNNGAYLLGPLERNEL